MKKNIQALVLAAGTGSRLKPYTLNIPKCMVPINGTPMIEKTILTLYKAGIMNIGIGLGYKSEVLRNFINEKFIQNSKFKNLKFTFIENHAYDKTNNIYSLYLAKDFFSQADTILLESDLIYNESIIIDLINSEYDNIAVVSQFQSWMDGTVTTLDQQDNVLDFIGKKSQDPIYVDKYFKTVNIYKFSKDFINHYYLPFLRTYMQVFGKNEYYETALKIISIFSPTLLKALKVSPSDWYEIDTPEDLEIASKKFSNL